MTQNIDDLKPLCIGRELDNAVQEVRIDCASWRSRHPALLEYRIEVTSPNGLVYLPAVHMDGDVLIWPITNGDTSVKGTGEYQVVAVGADGQRKTSAHHNLFVPAIMGGTAGEVPEPSQGWVDNVVDSADRAEEAATRAEEAAKRAEEALPDFGVEHAGKLLYIGPDGAAIPLALGAGLEIRDGVLVLTGTGQVVAELTVDADGNAVITGATLTVDADGNGTLTGATLTVDADGNAVLA